MLRDFPYSKYDLNRQTRNILSRLYPPKFKFFIGHHITESIPKSPDWQDGFLIYARIIGYSSDHSIECFIVDINGTYIRPDNKIYHLTWSHGPDRKPQDSNDITARYRKLKTPLDIMLLTSSDYVTIRV